MAFKPARVVSTLVNSGFALTLETKANVLVSESPVTLIETFTEGLVSLVSDVSVASGLNSKEVRVTPVTFFVNISVYNSSMSAWSNATLDRAEVIVSYEPTKLNVSVPESEKVSYSLITVCLVSSTFKALLAYDEALLKFCKVLTNTMTNIKTVKDKTTTERIRVLRLLAYAPLVKSKEDTGMSLRLDAVTALCLTLPKLLDPSVTSLSDWLIEAPSIKPDL